MRKFYFIVILFFLYGCSLTNKRLIEKDLNDNIFEQYPIESWNSNFKDFEKGEGYGNYIKNAVEFYPTSSTTDWFIYVYPQNHQFYSTVYQYDKKNYKLKRKGKVFGWNPNAESLKIGKWYEYDEQGKLIKETDEDQKFGKFGYNELLKFLDKEKKISLRKGLKNDINRDHKMYVAFKYSKTSDKKSWDVFVRIGPLEGDITPPGEIGERVVQRGKTYYIDGNTGDVIKRNKETLEYYKEIGFY